MVADLARRLNLAAAALPEESDVARLASLSAAAVRSEIDELADLLETQMVAKAETSMAQAPNERTKMAMRDLLLGGALLVSVAMDAGVVASPDDFDDVVDALAGAAATVLVET